MYYVIKIFLAPPEYPKYKHTCAVKVTVIAIKHGGLVVSDLIYG